MARDPRVGSVRILYAAVLIVVMWAIGTSAHETKTVGSLRLTIGWSDEPAFTGLKNSIEVAVSDATGRPIAEAAESFAVEAAFGDQRLSLPLEPVPGRAGTFRAWLVPTRSGTYAFRFTGTLRGQAIDTTSTCSAATFSCVSDLANLQFPVKDPSIGQFAERVTRTLPRAQLAIDTATRARTIAIAAAAAAGLGLVAAIAMAVRKGRSER